MSLYISISRKSVTSVTESQLIENESVTALQGTLPLLLDRLI